MQIAGHRTRVLELEGSGPGIVLLHGWRDNADGWRPLLAALALCGRRAIAVDLPGFGQATQPRPGRDPAAARRFRAGARAPVGRRRAGRRGGQLARRLRGAAARRAGRPAPGRRRRAGGARRARIPAGSTASSATRSSARCSTSRSRCRARSCARCGGAYGSRGDPRATQREVATRSPTTTTRASTPPRCSTPAAGCARAGDAVRPRRRRLPGAARAGARDRMVPHTAPPCSTAARHARRADRAAAAQLEAPEDLLELLLSFPE